MTAGRRQRPRHRKPQPPVARTPPAPLRARRAGWVLRLWFHGEEREQAGDKESGHCVGNTSTTRGVALLKRGGGGGGKGWGRWGGIPAVPVRTCRQVTARSVPPPAPSDKTVRVCGPTTILILTHTCFGVEIDNPYREKRREFAKSSVYPQTFFTTTGYYGVFGQSEGPIGR